MTNLLAVLAEPRYAAAIDDMKNVYLAPTDGLDIHVPEDVLWAE